MAITEQDRHDLYVALEATIGPEQATTLMEHLPPVGWADVATKRDLDQHTAAIRSDIEYLAAATKADIDALRAATKADLDAHRVSTKADLDVHRAATKADIDALRASTKADIDATRADIDALRASTKADIDATRADIDALRASTKADIEHLATMTELGFENLGNELRSEFSKGQRNLALAVLAANAGMTATFAGLAFAAAKFV